MSIEKNSSNRVAIVTGASRGLGAVIARVLAERRYDLVIGAREAQPLHAIADTLRAQGQRRGGRVATVAGDITDVAVRDRLIREAQALGGLHVLVNNASKLGDIAALADADPAGVARVLQVNVVAPLDLVGRALPLLAESRGLIVSISSDAAQGAYPGWGPYGASKAALDLLTRTLAAELRDQGVAAVSVDPGDMRTRMHQEAFPGQDISDRPLPDVTAPFWHWLFDQDALSVSGTRFAAQQEHAPWLQQV